MDKFVLVEHSLVNIFKNTKFRNRDYKTQFLILIYFLAMLF